MPDIPKIEPPTSKIEAFARLGLAQLPTPLQKLSRLSVHFGGPQIWAKRDDETGLGLGGNKLRKLEYVLYDAIAKGADTLVSGGVVQSNSQRLVAAAAAKLGLQCHLAVFHGRVDPPAAEYTYSGNAYLNRLFGATLHDVPWTGDRNAAIAALSETLQEQGKTTYQVPYGVSSPLGAIGYARAFHEIMDQALAQGMKPATIVHCSGSGGTQAGLIAGMSGSEFDVEILGIDIDAEPERVRSDVRELAKKCARLLGGEVDDNDVRVVAGYAGSAYGVPHQETLAAMSLLGRLEGMVLDPVYTGKAMAGLIAMLREGRWSADDHIVFIHSGGTPAVFAYGDIAPGLGSGAKES